MKKNKNGGKPFSQQGKLFAYAMITYAALHFAVFWVYINVDQFLLAFKLTAIDGTETYSLDNFRQIFNEFKYADSVMRYSLVNTIKYWVWGTIKLLLTVFIAFFLWKKIPGYKTYTLLFFLPSILPGVMLITLFKNMISTVGPLSVILQNVFGYEIPPLLMQSQTATDTIIFFVMWAGFGVNMLIYVGAFSRIPDSIIDAATLDGCTWYREMWSITMPLIWETLQIMIVLNVAGVFTASGPILYFTNGNAYSKTYTISFWIYNEVQKGSFNYPSAVGLFYTGCALPLVIITRYIANKLNKGVTF